MSALYDGSQSTRGVQPYSMCIGLHRHVNVNCASAPHVILPSLHSHYSLRTHEIGHATSAIELYDTECSDFAHHSARRIYEPRVPAITDHVPTRGAPSHWGYGRTSRRWSWRAFPYPSRETYSYSLETSGTNEKTATKPSTVVSL